MARPDLAICLDPILLGQALPLPSMCLSSGSAGVLGLEAQWQGSGTVTG